MVWTTAATTQAARLTGSGVASNSARRCSIHSSTTLQPGRDERGLSPGSRALQMVCSHGLAPVQQVVVRSGWVFAHPVGPPLALEYILHTDDPPFSTPRLALKPGACGADDQMASGRLWRGMSDWIYSAVF